MAKIPQYLVGTLYALHCRHDNHPCEHGYQTLNDAVQAAYMGLMTGALQEVTKITRGDVVVMSTEALRHRLGEIAAIPYN